MFNPTQADVRHFFCTAWARHRAGQPMDALQALAADWIAEHPEWHADFADANAALTRAYPDTSGQNNPFLHISMHLSISEQCGIDQPAGIRQAVQLLAKRLGSLHAAHHAAMECLGQMLFEAQRARKAPDGAAYVACVQRLATRD
ncbi:MAG: DUF1841 family protein [Burkholderiaceae bacterium]|nr:DUF1841 family protein [Burkholderiaceae bacterium]